MALLTEIRECLPLLEKAYQDCIHIKKDKKEYFQRTSSCSITLSTILFILMLQYSAYLYLFCKYSESENEMKQHNNPISVYALLSVLLSWSIFFVIAIKNCASFLKDTKSYLDLRSYMDSAKITLDGWMHSYLKDDEHNQIKNLLKQLNIAENKEVSSIIVDLKQAETNILLRNKQRLAFLTCGIRSENPIHRFFKTSQGAEKEMTKLIFDFADLGQYKI